MEFPPSMTLEFINNLIMIIEDFISTITEENIRKEKILILEILDEIIDFGYEAINET